MDTKTCTRCNESKPVDHFYKTGKKKRTDGFYYTSICKACNLIKSQKWREKNRERVNEIQRYSSIKIKYGLGKEEYLAMLEAGCAVCGDKEGLAVDHDHNCCPGKKTCGKCVRGMLCTRHNWAMGNIRDSEQEALALAEYIRNTRRVLPETS